MKPKQSSWIRLSLAAFAGVLLAAGQPAAAQTRTAMLVEVSSPLAARSAAGQVEETVNFSGQVSVVGREIVDTVFNAPTVLQLVIDLSKLTGTGSVSGRTFVTTAQAIVHRPLAATDKVQVSFAYYPKDSPQNARTGLLTLNVFHSTAGGLSATAVVGAASF